MSLEEDDSKGMDASAGRLVWVRRRNGSWWPGRTLSVDERTKYLLKKKAGTPIKLLGREEATVDWYNLEKSKRIKPFRCGEYDACIARAKAYAIRSNKRTSNSRKYARREDAIIHALELEKYHLSDGNQSKFSPIDKKMVKQRKMMFQKLISTERTPRKPEDISTNELSHSVVSFERPEQTLKSIIQFIQKNKRKISRDSEDDTDKQLTRMNGLRDLGLGMTSTEKSDMCISKKEACARDPFGSQSELDFDKKIYSVDPRSSFKHSCSSSRSIKMFRVYKNQKRRNRRRLRLTKIGLSSDKVNVPLIYQHNVINAEFPYEIDLKLLNDLKHSSKKAKISLADNGSVNCSESSCGGTPIDVQEKDGTALYDFNPPSTVSGIYADDAHSSGLVNVPVLFPERNMEGFIHMGKPYTSGKNQICLGSKSSEVLVEACSTSSAPLANHRTKKKSIELNSKVIGDLSYSSLYRNPNSKSSRDEAVHACDESLTADISDQSVRCGYLTELSSMQEVQTTPASINSDTSLLSDKFLRSSYSASSAQLTRVQDSEKHAKSIFPASPRYVLLDQMNSSSLNPLYDVELKVQANYHGRRAPLVSVVSKLNGKAIVGHAITADVLSDGSSTALLKGKQLCGGKHRSSPRKIRRLSSITVGLNGRENGGEVILEKAVSSSVSCIPIRVVFSRLNEALSCSPYSAK